MTVIVEDYTRQEEEKLFFGDESELY